MKIVVVGAGIIGLTSAISLAKARREDTVEIVCKAEIRDGRDLASHRTGGLWMPFHIEPEAETRTWGTRTFHVLRDHAAQGVGDGAVQMRTGWYIPKSDDSRPWWAELTSMTMRRNEEHDSEEYTGPAGCEVSWEFTTPMVHMEQYVDYLYEELARYKIPVRSGVTIPGPLPTAVSFLRSHHSADAIILCCGLGARTLLPDPAVLPARGAVLLARRPPSFPLTFLLDDSSPLTSGPAHNRHVIYSLPRGRSLLTIGGTYSEHDSRAPDVPGDEQARILARASTACPALRGVEVVDSWAGLRPVRRGGVRLGRGEVVEGVMVVYNYGHGGAGVTVCWGCAESVVGVVGEGVTCEGRAAKGVRTRER